MKLSMNCPVTENKEVFFQFLFEHQDGRDRESDHDGHVSVVLLDVGRGCNCVVGYVGDEDELDQKVEDFEGELVVAS